MFAAITLLPLAALAAAEYPPISQSMLSEAYERVSPAVCLLTYSSEITNMGSGQVNRRSNNALGLIVSPDGLVMTHGHMVLENAQPFNIRVTVGKGEDEKEYDAEPLEKPDDVNVVFLQIKSEEEREFPYVEFSPGAGLGLGQEVAIIGLLGSTLDFNRAIYSRRIGSVLEKPRTTYCLDDSIVFGFIGAPVIDGAGHVVGVTGFDLSPQEGGDLYIRSGHPLIYQADLFSDYIQSPPQKEEEETLEAEDAWIGVFTQPLTDDLAEYWNIKKDGGIVVSTVMPGSPAESAGLLSGDVIVNFDGTPVTAKLDREVIDFTKLVREVGPNKEVDVQFYRNGELNDMTVKLGARPKDSRDALEYEEEVFGLTVREITTDVRIQLNLPENVQGVIVRRIKSGSLANIAGMVPGVIIMNFNDRPVTNIEDFREAVQATVESKPEEFTIFCRVGPQTRFFRIQPRWRADE